jgi:HD-like signal output (HDOD) protein
MLADTKSSESHFRIESPEYRSDRFPTPQAGESPQFPSPPAMPGAVLLLQLRLASNVVDLNAVTGSIRRDVGLTVGFLRLAYGETGRHRASSLGMAELAVDLGVEKLRAMARATPLLSGRVGFEACQEFWRHARRTAEIAEELAAGGSARMRETAYIAGLLCHVGKLPRLLGWPVPGIESADSAEIGFHMTKTWRFPSLLAEAIRRNEQACTSPRARALLRLINAADRQASAVPVLTPAEVAHRAQSCS